ncbi:bifunctional deaminase-reductase, C-terminal protein [Kribbella flavida DSM 17836]|uniref:Bifunctional deaminase-reductase, C-terminal protein n=1 Tax=Kribbella flavida (strain DSM 17836 / JCM 10339 / NBRC 14399) TaxID=479435 RepID=D2PSG1_KRIFD
MAQLLRVQNFNVSSDGIGAGEDQSLESPFGHPAAAELFGWAGATASWPMRTDPGGSRGIDDYLTRDYARNIGAEIMGRHKFGPQRGPWHDDEWRGWWGDEPPFRTPVFVLVPSPSGVTHHLFWRK